MRTSLSVVIIHWNTPQTLHQQLNLLMQLKPVFKIVVVDNGSQSSAALNFLRQFPRVKVVKNGFNYGYSHAANQAVTLTNSDWLLYLNPDVLITVTQVNQLLNFAHQHQLDAVCPDYHNQGYAKPLPSLLSLLTEFSPLGKLIRLDWFWPKTLFGGCLLIRRNILCRLGGWDERFWLWFEDSDLTARLLKAGRKIGRISMPLKHLGANSFKLIDPYLRKRLFFHSLAVYTDKHFRSMSRFIVRALIIRRFSHYRLLPKIHSHVSLVVPNLKQSLLENFLKENTKPLMKLKEVIVITSALTNESVWQFRSQWPQIRFILLSRNNGFAPTVNLGFKVSTGNWLATINDDTLFNLQWLRKCLLIKKNKIGSINPIILTANNKIESAGIKILKVGKAMPITKKLREINYQVDATNAAAVIYSREVLEKVGLFDECFQSYLEDLDLSLRIARSGYQNLVCPETQIIHYGQGSSRNLGARKNWYDLKNWLYLIAKNQQYFSVLRYWPSLLVERARNLSGLVKACLNSSHQKPSEK